MIEIYELVLTNFLFTLLLLILSRGLCSFLIPRLELARGMIGNQRKVVSLTSIWMMEGIWKSRDINWRSLEIVVLSLQSAVSVIFLSSILTPVWIRDQKLLIPILMLISNLLLGLRLHWQRGEKDPNIQWLTHMALVGAMGMSVLLFGLKNQPELYGWWVVGYVIKWMVLFVLYLVLAPFITLTSLQSVLSPVVVRSSEIMWAIGLAMSFWPPSTSEVVPAVVEQFFKSLFILVIYDLSRVLFPRMKLVFMESILMSLVLPMLLLSCLLIVMGF